jgi:glycosyltransferase involved in cell wall biosynthesis
MPKKLFIVVNIDWTFLNYRKEIALSAKRQGFDVTIVTKNTGAKAEIERLGLKMIGLPMSRSSFSPFDGLKTVLFLFFLYMKHRPDIVHQVGLKIILFGSIAAKLACVKSLVNAVNGLGILFSEDNSSRMLRYLFRVLRFAHRQKRVAVIFQNRDDLALFVNNKIICENQACLTKGSGVDLTFFTHVPAPSNSAKINILFAARMIREKGVFELIEAANLLKNKYLGRITFLLCGGIDDNPHAIPKETLEKYSDNEYLQWLGYQDNMKNILEQSHIVAFPSYYREGIPKSLIEACAVGRPIVTTDSTGCRDTVVEGYNGFLIPPKDAKKLAEKLEILIKNPLLRIQMGHNARALAEKEFSVEKVIEKHLEIYSHLLSK